MHVNLHTFSFLTLTWLAFCSHLVSGKDVYITAPSELKQAVADAVPGTCIYLATDSVTQPLELSGQGTADAPIIIRPVKDKIVLIDSKLSVAGSYVTVKGFTFGPNSRFIFNEGMGHRLAHCQFSGLAADHWVRFEDAATHCEIAYCSFTNDDNTEKTKNQQVVQIKRTDATGPDNHYIHHNYFADISPGLTENGFETIQIHQGTPGGRGSSQTLIEYNLFERCNGEREIISIKCSENTIRYNVFIACQGALVFRAGHRNTAEGNIFLGQSIPGTEGIRMQGRFHRVINNYMQDLTGPAIAIHDGDPSDFYERSEDTLIAFNTVIDCRQPLVVGLTHKNVDSIEPPLRLVLVNNVFTNPDGPIIDYPDQDPDSWTIADNVFMGDSPGLANSRGFVAADPRLIALPIGIQVPGRNSPLIDAAGDGFIDLEYDLLKTSRPPHQRDIGALEYSDLPPRASPVTRKEVGPQAMQGSSTHEGKSRSKR